MWCRARRFSSANTIGASLSRAALSPPLQAWRSCVTSGADAGFMGFWGLDYHPVLLFCQRSIFSALLETLYPPLPHLLMWASEPPIRSLRSQQGEKYMRIGTSSLTLDLRFTLRQIILLAVVLVFGMPPLLHADIVTEWNTIATTVGPLALPAILPQSRVYAMTQAAVHNALNAIDRRYQPYAFTPIAASNASPEAAVATAVHDVLRAQFPSQQAAIDAAYQASLASFPDNGNAKALGIAVGQAAAAAILAIRSNDGSASANVPYTQPPGPGIWEPTPPGYLPPAFPGWGNVTPFGLNHGEQFRPDPPEYFDLTSEAYSRDY